MLTEKEVGKRIREGRLEAQLTLQEVASRVGVTNSTILRYEQGDIRKMKLPVVESIAKALGVSPEWLLGKSNDKTPVPHPVEAISIDLAHFRRIPILGRISAGLPIYAEQNIEGYTLTDLNGGAEYFGLRVSGDSMNALRINEGDVIIVRRQPEVENGEVAVVLINDNDATVKRFYSTDSTVSLMPQSTNPAHQPQIYDVKRTRIEVLGKVVKVEFTL